jgi:hypothetical protein
MLCSTELGEDLEGSGSGLTRSLCRHLSAGCQSGNEISAIRQGVEPSASYTAQLLVGC